LFALGCVASRAPRPDFERRTEELELPIRGDWASPADTTGASVAEQPFWTAFGDADLDAIVDEALQHNRSLGASAARLAAAAARSNVARSARWPNLDASLGHSRNRNIFVGLPIPGTSGPLAATFTSYNVGLTASWEVDLFGRLASGARGADAGLAAAAADLAAAQLAVAAEATRGWFLAREARQQVELARETLATYEGSQRMTEERFDAGLVGALDVRLVRANVASSRANLVAAERLEGQARRGLELVLGRYPGAELEALGDFGALPPEVPAGVPADLLARRPDLAALERRLVTAEALVSERRADRWPRIVLTATGGRTSNQVEDLLDGDFTVWSFASSLTAPIFDAGRRAAAVDAARADAHAAGEAFAGGVLASFAEVESALDAERRLRDGLRHLTVAVDESRGALELADAQYREGLIGIELVFDSQRRSLSAESALLATQRELFVNRVDLVVALGGGFSPAGAERAASAEPSN